MTRIYPENIPEAFAADEILAGAYRCGWMHGHGIACHNIPSLGDSVDPSVDYVGIGGTVDEDNIREYHELLCFAAEENSRCFSPFEYMAVEFNEHGEGDEGTVSSEDVWEAFEEGAADAIRADLSEYTDEDYGIEPEEDEEED